MPTSAISYWGIPRILGFFFFGLSLVYVYVYGVGRKGCSSKRSCHMYYPFTYGPCGFPYRVLYATMMIDGRPRLPSRSGRQGHVLHCSSRILVSLIGLQQWLWYSIVQYSTTICAQTLAIRSSKIPRKGNGVPHVRNASQVAQEPIKPKPKSTMRCRPPASEVRIPLEMA